MRRDQGRKVPDGQLSTWVWPVIGGGQEQPDSQPGPWEESGTLGRWLMDSTCREVREMPAGHVSGGMSPASERDASEPAFGPHSCVTWGNGIAAQTQFTVCRMETVLTPMSLGSRAE